MFELQQVPNLSRSLKSAMIYQVNNLPPVELADAMLDMCKMLGLDETKEKGAWSIGAVVHCEMTWL